MNVAEAIVSAIHAEGVGLAAGISGASGRLVADPLCSTSGLKVCYARQERVAVDIADGYARVSGTPGVIFTDTGPAVANTFAGIVNSYGDSVPLLFLAAQIGRFGSGRRTTKELAIRDVFEPVTKWTTSIMDPSQTYDVVRRAFVMMRSGRPGPVVVELPFDVAEAPVQESQYEPIGQPIRSAGDPADVERAVRLLLEAQRPYLYVGAGVLYAEASPELVRFAELLTIPVATTLNGKSAFPEDHPLSLGIGGFPRATYGTLHATRFAKEADVVLTIGCGFKKHATEGNMPPDVKHIQVDVDLFELHKESRAQVTVLGDAKLVLSQMLEAARSLAPKSRLEPRQETLEKIAHGRGEWMALSKPHLTSDEKPINPFRVTWELSQAVDPARTIVLHDAGSVRGSTCQHYLAPSPRSFIGFGVESAMGWSLGAAMGAKLAAPEKLVVAVTGDEAFGETALDLETASRHHVPILLILCNNRGDPGTRGKFTPSTIHQYNLGGDYCGLAGSLGVQAMKVESPQDLQGALKKAIAIVEGGEPGLLEVVTRRVETRLFPAEK